jgi:hypothetical protein
MSNPTMGREHPGSAHRVSRKTPTRLSRSQRLCLTSLPRLNRAAAFPAARLAALTGAGSSECWQRRWCRWLFCVEGVMTGQLILSETALKRL